MIQANRGKTVAVLGPPSPRGLAGHHAMGTLDPLANPGAVSSNPHHAGFRSDAVRWKAYGNQRMIMGGMYGSPQFSHFTKLAFLLLVKYS